MQFSNGLNNPVGLWLGHLLFDSIFSVVVASIICLLFFGLSRIHFNEIGLLVRLYIFSCCRGSDRQIPVARDDTVWNRRDTIFICGVVNGDLSSRCVRPHSGLSSSDLHCKESSISLPLMLTMSIALCRRVSIGTHIRENHTIKLDGRGHQ